MGRRPTPEWKIRLIVALAGGFHRLLTSTHRLRRVGRTHAERRRAGEDVRCIYAGWHCQLVSGMNGFVGQDVTAMISSHRDGEYIARVAEAKGFRTIRGSSTRGGSRAMREFVRAAREMEGDLLITVDGPRGPAREIKEGILLAASLTGLPIVPIGMAVDRAWYAKSWDRHVVAKPFARVVLALGEELHVPRVEDREELVATWRPRLAEAMVRAEDRARQALQGGEAP